ncbi:SpoIID/LytB domain-containing protein [bacterium]|nr:SpoIID/LytB domain-containing protein [bacterium]
MSFLKKMQSLLPTVFERINFRTRAHRLFRLELLLIFFWISLPTILSGDSHNDSRKNDSLSMKKPSPNKLPTADDVRDTRPLIRVGLLEGYEKVSLQINGPFAVENLKGETLRPMAPSNLKWRVRVEEAVPSQFIYSVLVMTFADKEEAITLAEKLEKEGSHAYVRSLGNPVEVQGNILRDNTRYRVQVGNFENSEDAEELLQTFIDDYAPRVVRELMRRVSGKVELFDAKLEESWVSDDGVRIVPADLTVETKICSVRVGTGFRWETEEDRSYAGVVEIRLDHDGKLCAISEVPIDVYLRGVVPSEMPAGFPREALKAQAVAARSEVLAKLHTKHLNDPFDVCGTEHCQVYAGVTQEDPRTNEAVIETSGEVLMRDGILMDAVYSAVCGGHTEDAARVWASPPINAAEGVWCTLKDDLKKIDLTTEENARKWILSKPDVCCNIPAKLLPVAPDYTHRHFRWEVTYNRAEFEKIIARNTGQDIGTFYDIIPLERGVSGRLVLIEILGSHKNLKIKKELNIRRALSPTMLESSCFVVDIQQDEEGLPVEITLNGAGWGHGAGMCQVGAAYMAVKGKTYHEILNHYYRSSTISRCYSLPESTESCD